MPRHVRWTLLMINIMLVWFICAVIYNQTKSPLEVPDMISKASKLATEDIWIAVITPLGNIILMYLLGSLFYIPKTRLENAGDLKELEVNLREIEKEKRVRFILSYIISICMYCGIGWYLIKFTSTFGWKTSWAWWYSGCGAAILQFFVYDAIVNLIQWALYKAWNPLGLIMWKIRSIK